MTMPLIGITTYREEAAWGVWRQRADLEERNHEIAVELARHQEAEAMLRKTLVTAERSADVMRADARREAERIVREAEQTARECGKTLLVLDAVTGGDAARLYARMGWTEVGAIPGYALMPRGGLSSTTYFYKALDPGS